MGIITLCRSGMVRMLLFSIVITVVLACEPVAEVIPEYGWFEFVVKDLDTLENEVDLSFLNEGTAGSEGFVKVRDGHFVNGSGEQIRFFGTNLTFSSCFPEKDIARQIASRLRIAGMNVVRFHHMDMRMAPGGIWDETMEHFDAGQLDKLDWLIYQLKINGVYTNLNLHVSRTYPGLEPEVRQFQFGKTLDHFYRPYIDLQKAYAHDLLTHVNPYTGKSYIEEPAIAFIEINNENSLLSNWKHLTELKGMHRTALLNQWKEWIRAAGAGSGVPDIFRIVQEYETTADPLHKELFWQFLVEVEMNYTEEMIGYVRNDLKAESLIADSQGSYSGIAGVVREATYSDFMDMHAYWEHPRFPNTSWSRTDWLIRNSSMVSDKRAGTLARFGQHRVKGMPLTISEYDHPAPNFYCAEMYPMLNTVASFQNWDGIYHFTFDAPYDQGRIRGFFSSAGHPLKQIFIPVGAAIFRMNGVTAGDNPVRLHLNQDMLISELVESGHRLRLHGSNMDYIWEKAGAPIALTLLNPMEIAYSTESDSENKEPFLSESVAEPEGIWESASGEIRWDNRDSLTSVFMVNSEAVKIAAGYIGGREVALGNVTIAMDSTPYNWATITLTALDGRSIDDSEKILLVAAGRVENSNMGWDDAYTTVGADWGEAPTRAEGIPAKILIKDTKRFKAYALDAAGNLGEELPVRRSGGEQSLVIGAQYNTLWYILKRE